MGQAMASSGRISGNSYQGWLSPPLQVIECRVYRGPHLYSHTPMIRIQVDLGALEEWPTSRLPGFSDKLLACLPGLAQHTCSLGKPGGFASRLNEGTWMGHVIEHVALEIQAMAGMGVTRGKTRSVRNRRGQYNILYASLCRQDGHGPGSFPSRFPPQPFP
jgi:cyanophycin synthetase